jgi:hypothetical protein
MSWFHDLVSGSADKSVKRFIFIIIIATLITLAFIATYTAFRCPQEMYDTLAWLAVAAITGNVVEKFKKTPPSSQDGNNS